MITIQQIRQKLDSVPRLTATKQLVQEAVRLFYLYYDIPASVPEPKVDVYNHMLFGSYAPSRKSIVVGFNKDHDTVSGNKFLFAVFHELRHWWQFEVAGLATVESTTHYHYFLGDHMPSYKDAKGDDYNNQPIEQDAHKSAMELLDFYHLLHK